MKLITTGNAGTMESNDIMITVEPSDAGGVQVELTSSVYQQFGKQIIAVIQETAASYGVENALITAVDKGALDCTVRARVATALTRAAECRDYPWEVRQDVSKGSLAPQHDVRARQQPRHDPGCPHLRRGLYHVRSGGQRGLYREGRGSISGV